MFRLSIFYALILVGIQFGSVHNLVLNGRKYLNFKNYQSNLEGKNNYKTHLFAKKKPNSLELEENSIEDSAAEGNIEKKIKT
jgi:hypothetical protein